MSWRLWTNFILCATAALSVAGQNSNVTECIPSYNWSFNAKGQTPCLVAAYLESACGIPTTVDAIPPRNHYLGPSFARADPCQCNTVTYSMISACGGCQDRTFGNFSEWTLNCPSVLGNTFPRDVPDGTAIPQWAFANISLTGNNFSPVVAAQIAGTTLPTTTTTPPPPASSPSTTNSVSTPVQTPSSSPVSASGEGSHSNAGPIAGGVVGGLVLLAIIGLGVLWWYMRKKRNAVQKDLTFDHRALVSNTVMSQTTGTGTHGPSPAPFSQSLYDTSDLSTYPGSPMTSAVYTHLPGSTARASRRSIDSVSPSVAQLGGGLQNPHQPRGFTGAAEVV